MLTLARYGNKWPGNEPVLTNKQIKKCIFSSFPLTWQQQFIRSGQRVAVASLSDIIEFMSNEKIFADAQNANKDKKKPFSTKDNSFKKRKANGKTKFDSNKRAKEAHGDTKPNAECPIHGGHPWIKCFNNPSGDNYKPPRDGHRPPIGGRGRGRGGYPNSGCDKGGHGIANGRGNGQYSF